MCGCSAWWTQLGISQYSVTLLLLVFCKSKVAQYRRDPFHISIYGTPVQDYLFCRNLAVLWYNSEVNHWSVLESLGIPIWIGQNRSQLVFASWYDDVDCCSKKGVRKGEELKAPRYTSAMLTRDYIIICDIIPNTFYNLIIVKIVCLILKHN